MDADANAIGVEADRADPLLDRPARTRQCERCSGRGIRDQPYVLAPNPPELTIRDAPAGAILAFVVGTGHIHEACGEAVLVARASARSVAFDFNGITVIVGPGDDAGQVAAAWWVRAYGETPEQTRERR